MISDMHFLTQYSMVLILLSDNNERLALQYQLQSKIRLYIITNNDNFIVCWLSIR